jgi:hypothetical protein
MMPTTAVNSIFNPFALQLSHQSFSVGSASVGFFLTVLRRFGLGLSSVGFSEALSFAAVASPPSFDATVFLAGAFLLERRTGAFLTDFSPIGGTSVVAGGASLVVCGASVATGFSVVSAAFDFGLARVVLRRFGFSSVAAAG